MSTSYAYDPSGKKIAVTIKDGKTYLADGSRIPTGYTVETGGGIYKMTDNGGVKVDSHNTAEKMTSGTAARQATDAGEIKYDRPEQKTGYTKVGNTYITNKDLFADDPVGSYTRTNYDFFNKYKDIIESFSKANNADWTTATEMLKTNLNNNKGIYSGGGVIPTEKWNEMLQDYANLKKSATDSTNDPRSYTRDASGKEVATADILKMLQGNPSFGQGAPQPYNAGPTNGGNVVTGNTEVDQAIYEYSKYGNLPGGAGGGAVASGNNELINLLSSLNKGVLSYKDAEKLANAQLGRSYDKTLDESLKNIDRQALQSGFFGQLPTLDYKQRNADDIALDKEQAIAQLAYQLMNDSENDAMNYFNTVNNYNNQEWEKAFKEREYAASREDTAWEKAYKESGLTGIFQGQPTLAMTELAHAIGMDEKKMQMAEIELNHEIDMAFENLKNDKIALSQAWARIGQSNEANQLDREKFMAGIKEQAWKMTMDQLEKSGTSTDGLGDLDFMNPNLGGPRVDNLEMEEQIELIWGSYVKQLLDQNGVAGWYE